MPLRRKNTRAVCVKHVSITIVLTAFDLICYVCVAFAAINHCDANPCVHSVGCTDLYGGYECECEPGWGGQNCDVDANECLSTPCKNGATCVNQFNSYTCECKEEFTGTHCETGTVLIALLAMKLHVWRCK